MPQEDVRCIIAHALTLLAQQSEASLRAREPWLTHTHIQWCQQHWADRDPADHRAMQLLREAAAVLRTSQALLPADWEVIYDVLAEIVAHEPRPRAGTPHGRPDGTPRHNRDVHRVLAKVATVVAAGLDVLP